MKHIKLFEEFINEERPEWQDADFPDANGRFRDLNIKDLATWLIKSRKKDLKAISGSLTQQIVFNRNDDPDYADKMEKTRIEVYKQLGRTDLLERIESGVVTCDSCGWHWNLSDGYDGGERNPYLCHKCGHNNKPSINESEETYNDYPAAATKNAQMAIDWKEKYGRDEVEAGTPVGWARANQLANKENISVDTINRMSAFNRHRKNSKIDPEFKDTPWKDKGYVAWLIWGGDEGVDWAMKKADELRSKE